MKKASVLLILLGCTLVVLLGQPYKTVDDAPFVEGEIKGTVMAYMRQKVIVQEIQDSAGVTRSVLIPPELNVALSVGDEVKIATRISATGQETAVAIEMIAPAPVNDFSITIPELPLQPKNSIS